MSKYYYADAIAAGNPTGLLDFNSTLNLKGQSNIVASTSTIATDNLEKSNNNEVICSSIDHFKNNDKKINKEIILIIIFLAILIILHFI